MTVFKRILSRPVQEYLMLGVGIVLLALLLPSEGPLSGLDHIFVYSDLQQHYVAALAAMYDPIDWAHPLAISTLSYPFGTSLLMTDAFPPLILPLRILWQAGIEIDPPLALDLWVGLMTIIAPLSVYRLAHSLGASPWAAVISGLIGASMPGLHFGIISGSQGLASWPLLALFMAELVLLERGRSRRYVSVALLGGLLWWCHASSLGPIGAVLASGYALTIFRHRSWRAVLPVLGSMVGLGLLYLADAPAPPGLSLKMPQMFFSALPGLFSLAPGYTEWGVVPLILFLLVQPLLWRTIPWTTPFLWILVIVSLGSPEFGGGGVIPAELIRMTPFAFFDDPWRMFIVAALIGAAAAPALIEQLLARYAQSREGRSGAKRLTRWRRVAQTALLLLGVAPLIIGELGPRTPLGGLMLPWAPEDTRALPAVSGLIRVHDTLLFLPDPDCETERLYTANQTQPFNRIDEYARDLEQLRGLTMGFALLALRESVPAYSFYSARSYGGPDRSQCRYFENPPPPGTLVVAWTRLERDPSYQAPWEEVVTQMARCSGPIKIGVIKDVRFCSDNVDSIEVFERRLFALSSQLP